MPGNRHTLHTICALVIAVLAVISPAKAQLASSFCNVTGITARTLPNAVQVTIQADGAVRYGFEAADFANGSNPRSAHSTSQLKIRIIGARMSMPAFVDIGAYPVDSAAVSVGQGNLILPYGVDSSVGSDPAVDVTLRFYVPVTPRKYDVGDRDSQAPGFLGPREMQVKRGSDRSSIVITIVTDRSDYLGESRLQRSRESGVQSRLSVTPLAGNGPLRLKVDALHAPLRDVMARLSDVAGKSFAVEDNALTSRFSGYMPSASVDDVIRAIEVSCGLSDAPSASGQTIVGHTAGSVIERIPLTYLKPEAARLLLPDFLLPRLRVDSEHNALIASTSPNVLAHLRKDLAFVDRPPTQLRIEADVYEFSTNGALDKALKASRTAGYDTESLDTEAGQQSIVLARDQSDAFTATVSALQQDGLVRVRSHPSVTVTSGNGGSLFLGQQRYVVLLQRTRNGQSAQAVKLSIGTRLFVYPTMGDSGNVGLFISAKVSTIDEIEPGTGLPTVGTREFSSAFRLTPGEVVMLSGLSSDFEDTARKRTNPWSHLPLIGGLFHARHSAQQHKNLVLLVRATPV